MHRVRLVLPYLSANGIDAEVLAVQPAVVAAPEDPWMAAGLPGDIPVHAVSGMGLKWSRIPGLGSLSYRVMGALRSSGSRHLAGGIKAGKPFNLVYFSTTQFGVHSLGPFWKKRYGVPFVMDYQDSWVSDYYQQHPDVSPPGGRLKYRIARYLSQRAEPKVLRQCSGITSVSEAYPKQLHQRYDFLTDDWPVLVSPFPGDQRDLDRVGGDASITQHVFDSSDGLVHWVYVGRGGQDMHHAIRGLFLALKRAGDGQSIGHGLQSGVSGGRIAVQVEDTLCGNVVCRRGTRHENGSATGGRERTAGRRG